MNWGISYLSMGDSSDSSLRQMVREFLQANIIMQLAYIDENKPALSVLLYYIDGDLNFYFATHADSIKSQALKKNPSVSLNVWEHNKIMVQANCQAKEITTAERRVDIIDKLAIAAAKNKDFWPPLLRISGEDYVVFRLVPEWMRVLDLTRDTITQKSSPFTEVKL